MLAPIILNCSMIRYAVPTVTTMYLLGRVWWVLSELCKTEVIVKEEIIEGAVEKEDHAMTDGNGNRKHSKG